MTAWENWVTAASGKITMVHTANTHNGLDTMPGYSIPRPSRLRCEISSGEAHCSGNALAMCLVWLVLKTQWEARHQSLSRTGPCWWPLVLQYVQQPPSPAGLTDHWQQGAVALLSQDHCGSQLPGSPADESCMPAYRLPPPLPLRAGPWWNAQVTCTGCVSSSCPSMPSIAAWASFFVAYSTIA